jgi:hypothetical protein
VAAPILTPSTGYAGSITRFLHRAPTGVFILYAVLASFTTYFCMYAFRKPFDAALYEGSFFNTPIKMKTMYVISQILGYTISKFLGTKICSEASRASRRWLLIGFILWAETALLLFAILPPNYKFIAMFLNGLPLGMVWGMCVWYLEGRRTSEVLLVGLSCSYIVAGPAVRDFGLSLMRSFDISEAWMPVAVGGCFLPIFLLAVWLLDQLPSPKPEEVALRQERVPMNGSQRWGFLKHLGLSLVLLLAAYFFLTAFRDFREHYGREIFDAMGYEGKPAIFLTTELWAAFGTMIALTSINLLANHRRAVVVIHGFAILGYLIIGGSTWLFTSKQIDGLVWMSMVGVGLYLAYVPVGAILFERLLVATKYPGTAVFGIQLADAIGYTGSVIVQLYRDFAQGEFSRLQFFEGYAQVVCGVGVICLTVSCLLFLNRHRGSPES